MRRRGDKRDQEGSRGAKREQRGSSGDRGSQARAKRTSKARPGQEIVGAWLGDKLISTENQNKDKDNAYVSARPTQRSRHSLGAPSVLRVLSRSAFPQSHTLSRKLGALEQDQQGHHAGSLEGQEAAVKEREASTKEREAAPEGCAARERTALMEDARQQREEAEDVLKEDRKQGEWADK